MENLKDVKDVYDARIRIPKDYRKDAEKLNTGEEIVNYIHQVGQWDIRDLIDFCDMKEFFLKSYTENMMVFHDDGYKTLLQLDLWVCHEGNVVVDAVSIH